MPALDAKAYLTASLKQQHQRFINDLTALPEEARSASFAGCARPPIQFAAECALLNNWIADVLQDIPTARPTDEVEQAIFKSVDTMDKALAMLQESVTRLQSAFDTLDEDSLGTISDKPFGRPVPLFQCAFLPISHLMYHDGQLNYIQTLHWDDKIHW